MYVCILPLIWLACRQRCCSVVLTGGILSSLLKLRSSSTNPVTLKVLGGIPLSVSWLWAILRYCSCVKRPMKPSGRESMELDSRYSWCRSSGSTSGTWDQLMKILREDWKLSIDLMQTFSNTQIHTITFVNLLPLMSSSVRDFSAFSDVPMSVTALSWRYRIVRLSIPSRSVGVTQTTLEIILKSNVWPKQLTKTERGSA